MRVELIDINNNPTEKIFKSYRICYSSNRYEDIASKSEEEMIKFIKPYMDEGHTSPLEHVSVTFSIEGISRACLAQLTRHRTGKFNVQSQRYVDADNFDFLIPDLSYIEDEDERKLIKKCIKNKFTMIKDEYKNLIDWGIKKEDARAILPQATTCNLIVTFDLNNFRKFLNQRLCVHAQKEIRDLAKEMNKLVKEHVPFVDYKVLRCQQGLCKTCIDK